MGLFKRMLAYMFKTNPLKGSNAGNHQRTAWNDNFLAEILFD
jgi:hypothetical protein